MKAHGAHVVDMLTENHEDPKVFWNYIKSVKENLRISSFKMDLITHCEANPKEQFYVLLPRKTKLTMQNCHKTKSVWSALSKSQRKWYRNYYTISNYTKLLRPTTFVATPLTSLLQINTWIFQIVPTALTMEQL